jgi:2,3-bisphosphoglycerate-independent phosphoglycerate mutase
MAMVNGRKVSKPIVLVILDGWGVSNKRAGNAIALAKTSNYDRLVRDYAYTTLSAAGEAVGLPAGQMGNSEVGHLNLGAGRIVYQEITRISKAIKNGDFFKKSALQQAMENARQDNKALHLMGLLSDGGVHSHIEHLFALLNMAKSSGVKHIFVHIFLDGRDVPPKSALSYTKKLETKLRELGRGQIASVIGRYYAMDRDKRWERTKLAYEAMVYGKGEVAFTALEAVEKSYQKGVVDEFVKPTVIVDKENKKPVGLIKNGDSIIFFNLRADRARQLTRAFIEKDFAEFQRGVNPPQVFFVCMTVYDIRFKVAVAFPPQNLKNVLAEVLADHGLKQLHVAETEKYAHVTFFFNGGVEKPKKGEDRILIPSPKVSTYDQKPEMSAYEVAETIAKAIKEGRYDVIIANFANGDMVGHTGVLLAAIKAAEAVDSCLGRIEAAISSVGGELIITSDHGNADQMIDYEHNQPFTAHTKNPVPFIIVSHKKYKMKKGGLLADVAPTVLELLDIEKPQEMTGESLIVH